MFEETQHVKCEALEEFSSGLKNLIMLEELDSSIYRKLKRLEDGFKNLKYLKMLNILECEDFEEFLS